MLSVLMDIMVRPSSLSGHHHFHYNGFFINEWHCRTLPKNMRNNSPTPSTKRRCPNDNPRNIPPRSNDRFYREKSEPPPFPAINLILPSQGKQQTANEYFNSVELTQMSQIHQPVSWKMFEINFGDLCRNNLLLCLLMVRLMNLLCKLLIRRIWRKCILGGVLFFRIRLGLLRLYP